MVGGFNLLTSTYSDLPPLSAWTQPRCRVAPAIGVQTMSSGDSDRCTTRAGTGMHTDSESQMRAHAYAH
eukprot:11439302-Alexandrium_andersonii.AAC.1